MYLLQLIPALSDVRSDSVRCGAAEALARVVDALQLQIVPYIVLLVIPLLGTYTYLIMNTFYFFFMYFKILL